MHKTRWLYIKHKLVLHWLKAFSKIKAVRVFLQLYFCYPEQIPISEMGSSSGSRSCVLNISHGRVLQSHKYHISTEMKHGVGQEHFINGKWLPIPRDPGIQIIPGIICHEQCRRAWWSKPSMPAQTTPPCSLPTARQPLHLLPCQHVWHSFRDLIMGFRVA